jgi:hypothetical protein
MINMYLLYFPLHTVSIFEMFHIFGFCIVSVFLQVSAQNDMDKKQNSSIFNPACDVYTMPVSIFEDKGLHKICMVTMKKK